MSRARVRIVLSRGQEFIAERPLEAATTIVGRDPTCDIVIDDVAVSKRHLTFQMSDQGLSVQDLGSLNGVRINGLKAQRQALKHLDVIEIGNHKMHVLEEAMLPNAALDLESTIQGAEAGASQAATEHASSSDRTQPGTTASPLGPMYALKRVDESSSSLAPLDGTRTVVGEPGKAALIVRRKDKLLLTKLSRLPLNVNGREVDGASVAVDVGDVIDVAAVRYQLVRVD